jgi:hypothetical protein
MAAPTTAVPIYIGLERRSEQWAAFLLLMGIVVYLLAVDTSVSTFDQTVPHFASITHPPESCTPMLQG